MSNRDHERPPVPYAPPPPKAPYPPHLNIVGCASLLVGAFTGILLPCAGFTYNTHNNGDPGGPLWLPLATFFSTLIGAILGPVIGFTAYWIIWRLSGRK